MHVRAPTRPEEQRADAHHNSPWCRSSCPPQSRALFHAGGQGGSITRVPERSSRRVKEPRHGASMQRTNVFVGARDNAPSVRPPSLRFCRAAPPQPNPTQPFEMNAQGRLALGVACRCRSRFRCVRARANGSSPCSCKVRPSPQSTPLRPREFFQCWAVASWPNTTH